MLMRHRKRQRAVAGAPTAVIGDPLAATSLVAAPQHPAAVETTPARVVRTTTPAAVAAEPTVTSRIIQGHLTTATPARVTTTVAAARTTTTTSAAAAAPTTPSSAARVASLSSPASPSSAPSFSSSSTSSASSSSTSSKGISGGAAAGIVIAILAVLALAGGWFVYRRRKAARSRGSGQALFSPDLNGAGGAGGYRKSERETMESGGVFGGSSASPTAQWGSDHEGEKYAGYGATREAQNPFNNPANVAQQQQYGAMPPQHQQPYPPQQQGWPNQQHMNADSNPSSMNLLAPAAVADPHAHQPSIEQREMQQELENRAQLAQQTQASPFGESEGQGEIRIVKGTFDPSLDDELVLYAGDAVQVLMKYDDGWALGLNLNSGRPPAKGVFPFDCLGEVCPPPAPEAVRANGQPPKQATRALSPPVPSALQPGSPPSQTQATHLGPVNPALVPLPPPTPTSLEPISEHSPSTGEGVKSGPPQIAPLALESSDSPLSASFPPHVQSVPAPATTGTMKRASSLIASRDADLFVALGEVMDKSKEGQEKKKTEQQGPSLI
ncbi:hypothetical protein JCM10295v2_001921 [Rhodotorula toruloides]